MLPINKPPPAQASCLAQRDQAGRAKGMRVFFGASFIFGLLLLLIHTLQAQGNVRESARMLHADPKAQAVISLGPEIADFDPPLQLPSRANRRPNLIWLRSSLDELYEVGTPANRILAFESDRDRVQLFLALTDQRCEPPTTIPGGWFDRWLSRAMPGQHRAREPILLFECVPGSMPT
jgi:hypothetical protein